jgi:hypothetical protein
MPAPPKRPPPQPVRLEGVVTEVQGTGAQGTKDSLSVIVKSELLFCDLHANELTAQVERGQRIVLFNSAPRHPTPFLAPHLNRAFMLLQSGRPPVVYVFRRYSNSPDLKPVSPRTYPYS